MLSYFNYKTNTKIYYKTMKKNHTILYDILCSITAIYQNSTKQNQR